MKKLMLIAACLIGAPAVSFALDDEPDGLSWELFSQDRNILLHFYDWAKANPPPIQTSQVSQTSQTFPYVWIKPTQIPFVETGARKIPNDARRADDGWTTSVIGTTEVLRFKRYSDGVCYQTFEVPEDGVYRFWIRYQHKKGVCESNSFRLTPALDEAHPEADDGSALFAAFEQMFAQANLFMGGCGYSRPKNPVPQISDVETPKDGFLWEATHKMAFLKKGKYTARFMQRTVTTPRGDIAISDYALIGDPFFSPEGMTRAACEAGRLPVPAETRSPLYAIRPGADLDNASPALRAWWRKWRQALYAKLIAAEHSKDYVWGTLASLPAFDEMLNTVDRISKFKALAETNRQMPDTYKINADEFTPTENWQVLTGQYDTVSCSHALLLNASKDGRAEYTVDVRRKGRYWLHSLIYQSHILKGNYRGALRLSVKAKGREIGSCIIGSDDGAVTVRGEEKAEIVDGVVVMRPQEGTNKIRRLWNVSDALDLPAGPVQIVVEGVHPPWAPKGSRMIWRRIFCRAVLTARPDFNPAIEHETPWGDRIGTEDIGFWRSPDPWTAFSRYSPLATGKYAEVLGEEHFRRYDWTPIDAKEVNCARHDIEAAAGEFVSELLMIRNNTEKTLGAEPKLSGDLPASCRLIAWCPAPDGEYVPRFLLSRARIALPAHQNTALWVNIDCRGAKEGTYPVTIAFAGKRHTWNVTVKGSIEDVPNPYAYPWAMPSNRKSCWELYRDLGFNVIQARTDRKMESLSKRAAETYGIRLVRDELGSFRPDAADDYTDRAKASVADWKRRGFDYKDFCYCLSDEPGFRAMTNWVKVAKAIKAADPKAQVWCNTGFFPTEQQWDDCQEFMSLWDVFCPFWHAFIMRPNRNAEHLKSYQKLGNPRLGYITPSTSIYWLADGANDSLWFAEECRNHGRDGWSIVRMQTNDGWDLDYPLLQAIFEGAWGRTLSTRYAEAAREANQRWRKSGAGIPKSN